MNELRQQWEEIDFDAVGLFRHLCRWDFRQAAVGLLLDLFEELKQEEDLPIKIQVHDDKSVKDCLVAVYRERLMEILYDPDGRALKDWMRFYRQDPEPHTSFIQSIRGIVNGAAHDLKPRDDDE